MSKKIFAIFLFTTFAIVIIFISTKNPLIVNAEPLTGSQSLVRYSEDFDGVTAPNLPNGWTVSSTGVGSGFVVTEDLPDTSPNSVFTPSPTTTSSTTLTSPSIFILGSDARLKFRHRYVLENTWDGAVLEIKIGDADFIDILDAGGEFLAGGYTTVLNPSTNPLQNRRAWSGANQGVFADVSVKLPAATFRNNVQFRWVFGSNDSFSVTGWKIDTITLEEVPTGLNTNLITISDNNPASPYPSEIQVNGLQGLLNGVVVNIENFSHDSPDDVDILLVSPSGRAVTLMSDVGGNTPVNNVLLSFDDAANTTLPDNSIISAGVYKPTNFEGSDIFPTPAPQTIPGSNLSSLFGDNPNGTWSLFVVDDSGNNVGTIADGWNLSIRSSVNACFFTVDPLFASFPHTGGSASFEITIPDGCPWTTTINNNFINFDSTNEETLSGIGSTIVNYNVEPNMVAGRTGIMSVSDGFTNRTVQIQQNSGCPFTIPEDTINLTSSGGIGIVSVFAGKNCVWDTLSKVNWVEINSDEQTGDGLAVFTVLENETGVARSTELIVGARSVTVNQLATSFTVKFDFDGDGRSDISVYRDGTWFLQQTTAGNKEIPFGIATDTITPADFDGDGKTDISVYREGIWYILQSSDGLFIATEFGIAGDVPTPADFNGDGSAELAVFRQGTWYTKDLDTSQESVVPFGIANDKPVVADYDSDGRADFAVYREGVWYLLQSTDGFRAVQFGIATDIPVVGDYNGDSKSDLAVYRDGVWHILTLFQNYSATQFGIATDKPVAADYDGDGKTDIAVYRDGIWYILQTSNGQFAITQYGLATDRPIPNAFVP